MKEQTGAGWEAPESGEGRQRRIAADTRKMISRICLGIL